MNIIICIDKNKGMMFNGRRQSQDSVLREKVLEIAQGAKLMMNAYTAKQFTDVSGICVSEDYFQEAKEGDFCFVEDGVLPNQGIEKFYVFCWNRNYPGDVFFEYDLKGNGFKKEAKEEFAGSSHDKIFLEVYSKKE